MEEKKRFNRVLTRLDILVLAFGAMIGWGWVVLSGEWITQAGSAGSIIAFLIGGILVLFVGLTYAELTTAFPKTGGAYYFVEYALGKRLAFIVSWALLLGYISVVAFEAVALPTVIDYIFPDFQKGYLWTISGWDVYFTWVIIGMAGSILITFINWIGVKQTAFLQLVLTLTLVLVGLLLATGAFANGLYENMTPLFTTGGGLLVVIIMTPFLFVGFDVIPQVAEEMNIPKKAIGKILILSVSFAVVWYVLIIVSVSLGLNGSQLAGASLATADAMEALFGSALFAKMLIIGGVAGILTSWNAFILGASRMMYTMAKEGILPEWFGNIHPTYKTPGNAILFIGTLSTLAPLLGRPALVWFVDAGGLAIVLAYFLVTLSFIQLRRQMPDAPRPFKAGNASWVGWVAAILSFGFITLYMPGMPSALIWPYEWLITIIWWAAGCYFLIKKPQHHSQNIKEGKRNEPVTIDE